MQGQISTGSVEQEEALEKPEMKVFMDGNDVKSGGELSTACGERKRTRKIEFWLYQFPTKHFS